MRWLPVAIRNWTDNCYFTTVFESIPKTESLDYLDDLKIKNFHWSEDCFLLLIQHYISTLSSTERKASSSQLLFVPFSFMVFCLSLPHLPTSTTNEMGFSQMQSYKTGSSQNPSLQAHPILSSQHSCHNMHFFLSCYLISCHVISDMRSLVSIGFAFLQFL